MTKSKYDPFFSRSIEHTPIAQAFFKQHLPQPTDLDTLVRIDRANTNDQLEQRRRDIAYKAQMQGEIALLLCAEHQSQPDIMMPLRFLYYGADSIAPYLKDHQRIPHLVQLLFIPTPLHYKPTTASLSGEAKT